MKRTIFLAALIAAYLTSASATTITITPANSIADAAAARNAWITATYGAGVTTQTVETFESYAYGPWTQLATGAGTFSVETGGLVSDASGTHTNAFTTLNSSDTPFQGRYNTTSGGNNWLDSNDITKFLLTTSFHNLYFFITDVNDVGGTLTMRTADGTGASSFAAGASDGNIYFVGIASSASIGSLEWLNNSQHDGYGLDDFGTVKGSSTVPEPSSWLVVVTGLLSLMVLTWGRSRKARTSALYSSMSPAQLPKALPESGRPGR